MARRLGAGAGEKRCVGEHFRPGQSAAGTVCLLQFGVQQIGHQIIGRVLRAPIDVLGIARAVSETLLRRQLFTWRGAKAAVRIVAVSLLLGLRNTEQHADRPHRHQGAEVCHEVEPIRADDGVQTAGTERPNLVFQLRDPPRCEHPVQHLAVHRVHRRILEDEHARRHLDISADEVQNRATARYERLVIGEDPLDVVSPADGVEVVFLVVVERRLFPQPPVHRVRVDIDIGVVRVVIQLDLARHRHVRSPSQTPADAAPDVLLMRPRTADFSQPPNAA